MIRFRVLGALDLHWDDGREIRAVLAQPKRVALLAYLAVARPQGFHQRDKLLPLFWPDANDERARAALSRAIYFLRHELGDDAILNRGDEISLNRSLVWCDATAFEEHITRSAFREALDAYRGDLLPGFFTAAANGFEEWLESERSRLRDRASRSAWAIADEEKQRGHHALAVHWGRQAVHHAPFHEDGIRRLLTLLEASGDRAGALITYEKFAGRLQSELELTPTAETEKLIAAMRLRNPVENGPNVVMEPDRATSIMARDMRPVVRPRMRRRQWAAVIAASAIIATPAILLARAKRAAPDSSRVAVRPFLNRTGNAEFDALGRVASDRIIQALTGTGILQVVGEPGVVDSRTSDTDSGRDLIVPGKGGTRAGIVVTGEIQRELGVFRVRASIFDVAGGRVVWTVPKVVANPDSLRVAIDEVSDRTTGAIAALSSPRFASWLPAASSPPTFAAFQEFAAAVELQLRGAHTDALEPLRRAVALDSTFIIAQLQLAVAYNSNYDIGADSIAQALDRKRAQLMPLQRHWVDWLLSLGAEDPVGGYRALKAAADVAPERFLHHLADAAVRLNRPREALRILARLGSEGAYHEETEYWSLLARSHHALGDHARELAVARRARALYPDRIDVLPLALNALAAEGRVAEVRALLDTALVFPRAKVAVPSLVIDMPGLGLWPGRLMVAAGIELRAHGFDEAADETFSRALSWYGDQKPAGDDAETVRAEFAKAHYYARHWGAAESIFRTLSDGNLAPYVYAGFLGAIAARVGDTTFARQTIAHFDTLRPTLVRPHAIVGYWQGKISAILGDEKRAIEGLTECFGPQGRSGMHSDADFEHIRQGRPFREFVRPKG